MTFLKKHRFAVVLPALLFVVACSTDETPDSPTNQPRPDAPANAPHPDAPGNAGNNPDAPIGSTNPDAPGAPDAGTQPPPPGFVCTTSTLWAGNPTSNERNTDDALTSFPFLPAGDAPSFDMHQLVFNQVNGAPWVFSYDFLRVYGAALTPAPADRTFDKVLGSTVNSPLVVGKCNVSRLPGIHGMTAFPGATDGSMVAAVRSNDDQLRAGSIVKISAPTDAQNCTTSLLGAEEAYKLPIWPIFVGGALYFIENDPGVLHQITKVTNNGSGTASRLLDLQDSPLADDGDITGVTAIGTKLYLVGSNGNNGATILEVDTTDPTHARIVKDGDQDVWGGHSVDGLATDGVGLITVASGVLTYVTLDGNLIRLAGDEEFIFGANILDEIDGYDFRTPKNAQAPNQVDQPFFPTRVQHSTADANAFLDYRNGKLTFVGSVTDNNLATIAEQLLCSDPVR